MEVMMLCLVSVTGRMYGSVVLCLVSVMSGFCDREDVWKCGVMSGLTNKGFCDRKDV